MAVLTSPVPWRFPLSPTLRDSDYFDQEQSDLFQNLEKLIASAVSICRLNGSLQCQIGGLITVIEELQRLLRHSFSEIKRLEKTLDHQKHNSTSKISNLFKQMKILEARVGTSNWTAQLSLPQDDPCVTPRSSFNSEKCLFHGEKDASQASEEGHVSLVDESYGNEESDNNLDEQPDEIENPAAVIVSDCADEGSIGDPEVSLESGGEATEKEIEEPEDYQSTINTNSNDQVVELSSIETTSDISPEETTVIPRNLRNSKQIIVSKNFNEGFSSKLRKCRSESVVKSRRMNLKSSTLSFPPVKKRERNSKQPRQVENFMIKERRLNRIKVKAGEGKGRPKIKTVQENSIPKGFKKNQMKKTAGSKSNFGATASKRKLLQEKPMDRYINLDFLLTVNQVMSDLVSDDSQEEAALDQVNEHAKKDVVNLAKLYRLRVRMAGKHDGEFPVVLTKGRESCLPKPGEVDSLLSVMSDAVAGKKQKKSGIKHGIDMAANNSSSNVGSKSKKKRV